MIRLLADGQAPPRRMDAGDERRDGLRRYPKARAGRSTTWALRAIPSEISVAAAIT